MNTMHSNTFACSLTLFHIHTPYQATSNGVFFSQLTNLKFWQIL